jgi:hypothetical protein
LRRSIDDVQGGIEMHSILERYGYSPDDASPDADAARAQQKCPFAQTPCDKVTKQRHASGICSIGIPEGLPIICCPRRLLGTRRDVLMDVVEAAFGRPIPLCLPGSGQLGQEHIAVFDKAGWSRLRLATEWHKDAYLFDYVLARMDEKGSLGEFVAVETAAIRERGISEQPSLTGVQPNWDVLDYAILPGLISKGYLLHHEPLCLKGLFVICQESLYQKMLRRFKGEPPAYPLQRGTVTVLRYEFRSAHQDGDVRQVLRVGRATTTVDHIARAFSARKRTPPAGSYEQAIRAQLAQGAGAGWTGAAGDAARP